MSDIILHQFEFSHFNDKARWALDFKDVDHTRISYLPGPHMPQIKKLSGQPQTPVLDWRGDIVAGSADIIDRLEEEIPEPALYPADENDRQRALELQNWLDSDVGPANRTVLFSAMVDEGGYMTSMFARSKPALARFAYRITFPLAKGLIKKGNGVNPENISRSRGITAEALDRIAEMTRDTGYLVGDKFTVADLAAAALFAPLANPKHPDMARPEPIPESVVDVLAEYKDHPTVAWVNRMYEKHRRA